VLHTVVYFVSFPLSSRFLWWLFTHANVLLTVSRFDWRLVVFSDTYRNDRELMSSVRSKGGYRAAVGFFSTRLLLLFRTCQFRFVDDCLLRLASYRCLSGATCGTSPALRFLRLCFWLDRSADCGCLGDCDSLASLSSLTALFVRYR